MLVAILVLSALANYGKIVASLQNKTYFTCAVNNNTSTIYLKPPLIEVSKNTTVGFENGTWHNWNLKTSTKLLHEPVVDKRWEDFEIIYIDKKTFHNITSLSFSIYSPGTITFSVRDSKKNKHTHNQTAKTTSWIHYTIFCRDHKIYFYENHDLFRSISYPNIFQITIQTADAKYLKIHNYQLRVTHRVSESPIHINVPKDITCLMFYAYLCSACTLDVYSAGSLMGRLKGQRNTFTHLMKAQSIILQNTNNVTLFTNTTNLLDTYWAIDVRHCPHVRLNKAIYQTELQHSEEGLNRTCEVLADKSDEQTSIAKQVKSRELRCEEYFWKEQNYCENYRICEYPLNDLKCLCQSWGIKQESCDNHTTPEVYKLHIEDETQEAFNTFLTTVSNSCKNVTLFIRNDSTTMIAEKDETTYTNFIFTKVSIIASMK